MGWPAGCRFRLAIKGGLFRAKKRPLRWAIPPPSKNTQSNNDISQQHIVYNHIISDQEKETRRQYCIVEEATSHPRSSAVRMKNLKTGRNESASDLKSGWCLSIEGGVEVSLETVLQHALEQEVDRGEVGAVGRFGGPVAPAPPVSKPASLPLPSTTAEPESPGLEKTELRGKTATSFDTCPGWFLK